MSDPRGASRSERDEYFYQARADHADEIAEARAEAQAEAAWDDADEYKIQREESRYLNHMLGGA